MPGFGIVGSGMISEFHANAIQAIPGAELVAVMDVAEKSARARGEQFGIKWYTDLDEFMAHPGLDIVTIGTPSGAHLEPVLAAAKAKKHVICEKPLEVTLERCDRMIAACKRAKVKLGGIFPSRTGESIGLLKKAMDQGRFGRLTVCDAYIKWYRTQEYYDSGGWRGTWKLDGGGALMNQSIHTIDLLQWLAGPVESIMAIADCLIHERIEVEDVAVAAVRFRSGAVGVIEGATAASPGHPREIHISGEKGSAFWKDGRFTAWEFAEKLPEDDEVMEKFGLTGDAGRGAGSADPRAISFAGHQRQFEDLLAAVEENRDPMVDGREARKAVEVILAVYKSAQTGRVAKLPLRSTPRLANAARAARKLRMKSANKSCSRPRATGLRDRGASWGAFSSPSSGRRSVSWCGSPRRGGSSWSGSRSSRRKCGRALRSSAWSRGPSAGWDSWCCS